MTASDCVKYLDKHHAHAHFETYQQSHVESTLTKIQLQTEGIDKTAVTTGWGMVTLTL